MNDEWNLGKVDKVYKLHKDGSLNPPEEPIKRTLTSVRKTLTPVKKATPVQKPYKDMKIPFGKHKGQLLADLPNSYLEWLMDQDFFEEKFKEHWEMTKKELEYRKKFNIYI